MGSTGAVLGTSLGSVLGVTAGGVFAVVVAWVAGAAVWLLGQVGHVMSATTTVDLDGAWFTEHAQIMAALAAAVILPMACCAVILAVYRQDVGMLVRGLLVKLPLALLFTGMSAELVSLALAVTDKLSDTVLAAGGVDSAHLLAPLAGVLGVLSAGAPGVPAVLVFLGSLLVVLGALVLWLELVVRAAAISVAALFLPLSLAGMVWPATSHWCRRLADTIAALVLSKLVVAAVLALAAGALTGGAGSAASGDVAGGFGVVVSGVALLLIATSSPFVLLRLVPAIEAGAVMHLEVARHRLQHAATAPVRAERSLAATMASAAGMLGGGVAAPGLATGAGAVTGGAGPTAPGAASGDADATAVTDDGVARGEPPGSPHGQQVLDDIGEQFAPVPVASAEEGEDFTRNDSETGGD